MEEASILEEALKGYQVAAQTKARFITVKFLSEDRQLHVSMSNRQSASKEQLEAQSLLQLTLLPFELLGEHPRDVT